MKILSFAFVASLVLALGGNNVHSATIVWTNAVSGNWNAPVNWSPNQVPLAADNAVITNNGTYTVTLDVNASVASLTLGGTSGTQSFALNANTLTLNGASTVGANGSFNLGGGTLGGTGSFTVNGPFNWSSGAVADTGGVTLNGTSTLNGAGSGTMQLDGLLVNAGALTWSGSGANFYFSNGTLTNLATATITITADVSTENGGGFNVIGNAGLLRKTGGTGGTTIANGVSFVNTGTLDAQNGNIALQGAYTLANGTKMGFGLSGSTGNGSISLSGAASFSGSLSVNFNNFFWPAVGSSFNLLNYASESGVLFTNVTLPATGNFTWQTNYNPTAFALSVIARTGTNLVSTNLFLSNLNSTNVILQWPGDHTGWSIQAQTNPLTMGLGTNWSVLANSSLTNQIVMPNAKTNGTVFFRMVYP